MDNRFGRTELLIGKVPVAALTKSRVLVIGVGGVGGYAVEMLARSGVGAITICDGDRVDITNINRQIIALSSTIGKYKCDVFRDRIADINPECAVTVINDRYSASNSESILSDSYDYVIDAIDSVADKLHLISEAHRLNINIISAMGAGNRYIPSDFAVSDIFSTSYDPLSKKMRKLLREHGISKHTVVYTQSEATPCEGAVGSISYMPALAGVKLGAYVINELIKNIKE